MTTEFTPEEIKARNLKNARLSVTQQYLEVQTKADNLGSFLDTDSLSNLESAIEEYHKCVEFLHLLSQPDA